MTLRSVASICTFSLALFVGSAQAAVINYTISFTGGGPGINSIGPGSFSFDSGGLKNVSVLPPVTIPNYTVPANLSLTVTSTSTCAALGAACNNVIFTQTSPGDDAVFIDSNGLVSALAVDSSNSGDTLQLNIDNTWTLNGTSAAVAQSGGGTYTINAADVPEPASLALIAAGLAGLACLRRKRT